MVTKFLHDRESRLLNLLKKLNYVALPLAMSDTKFWSHHKERYCKGVESSQFYGLTLVLVFTGTMVWLWKTFRSSLKIYNLRNLTAALMWRYFHIWTFIYRPGREGGTGGRNRKCLIFTYSPAATLEQNIYINPDIYIFMTKAELKLYAYGYWTCCSVKSNDSALTHYCSFLYLFLPQRAYFQLMKVHILIKMIKQSLYI